MKVAKVVKKVVDFVLNLLLTYVIGAITFAAFMAIIALIYYLFDKFLWLTLFSLFALGFGAAVRGIYEVNKGSNSVEEVVYKPIAPPRVPGKGKEWKSN